MHQYNDNTVTLTADSSAKWNQEMKPITTYTPSDMKNVEIINNNSILAVPDVIRIFQIGGFILYSG